MAAMAILAYSTTISPVTVVKEEDLTTDCPVEDYVIVLLAAFACAAAIEKRCRARPWVSQLLPLLSRPYGYNHYPHKRSAEPEPEAEASPSNGYYPVYHSYLTITERGRPILTLMLSLTLILTLTQNLPITMAILAHTTATLPITQVKENLTAGLNLEMLHSLTSGHGEHPRATMKFLVIVLLAASACAAAIEKRDAEPDHGYRNYYPYYPRPYGYNHYHHKRSAEPEAEAEASPSNGYYPVYHSYPHHHGKRSADPYAYAEPYPYPYPYAELSNNYGYYGYPGPYYG
ncbi:uncharacterized protein LOC135218586 [Macrobrachium nipponense]|uniref:uncharacterized protein LOC135218586 n=1 Tax=Macrobrachium nipponense TaxID=159736 RepID=UPI0030C85B71